jgi:hypothetical protein
MAAESATTAWSPLSRTTAKAGIGCNGRKAAERKCEDLTESGRAAFGQMKCLNQHPLPLGVVGLSPPFIDEVYAADRPPSATTGMRRFTGS